jgi:hypothetical protein
MIQIHRWPGLARQAKKRCKSPSNSQDHGQRLRLHFHNTSGLTSVEEKMIWSHEQHTTAIETWFGTFNPAATLQIIGLPHHFDTEMQLFFPELFSGILDSYRFRTTTSTG